MTPSYLRPRRARALIPGSFLYLYLTIPAHAAIISDELQRRVHAESPEQTLDVIVSFEDKIAGLPKGRAALVKALKRRADRSQRPLRQWLRGKRLGEGRALWMVNAAVVTVPAKMVAKLARLPGVRRVGLDGTFSVPAITYDTAITPGWNLSAVNAPSLWQQGYTGQGVVVANMDTGVDVAHPDLAGKWRGGGNSWFDPYGVYASPQDTNGHGTYTMGVLVGGDAGGQAIGVAPGAQWIAVKIFDDTGVARYSAVHQGFQWLLDPDGNPATNDAPDVVNNSWGIGATGVCDAEFRDDVAALAAAGIAVVFSAGNAGGSTATSISPANYPESMAVGATDEYGALAPFSAHGPSPCDGGFYPNVVAPGVNIRTADLSYGGFAANPYINVSGTSFSAPHVSGGLALLKSAFRHADTARLESALEQTAVDLGLPGVDNDYGWGLMDVQAAYGRLRAEEPDSDGDGVLDYQDNCTQVANADQRDSNGDGYGNQCDPDLNDDGVVDVADFDAMRQVFLGNDANADLNGDGYVNYGDLAIMRAYYLQPPGPSGLAP